MAALLINVEQFDNFEGVKDFPARSVIAEVIESVRNLDEREELEPFILSILSDTNTTPHGPVEIADILTHKVSVNHEVGLSAFILKGRSFRTVRPAHVSHQIYRLEKITGLRYAIFAATGTILDQAKEQFVATAVRLGIGYAIFDANDLARLFLAHGFFCPRDGRRIVAGRCHCGYSPRKRILNVFQKDTLLRLKEGREIGQTTGLIVLPPGSGKTRIAAEDAKQANARRVLYVADTYEILDVAQSEFSAVFGSDKVTTHNPQKASFELKQINLASIQLLESRKAKFPYKAFDYVIIDEFHHAAAKSYRRLMKAINPKFLIGLTATPFRGDRQDIAALCADNVFVNFELRSGINAGLLCPYHYHGCFDDIDYSRIKHNGMRYDIRDLEKSLVIAERDSAVIEKWTELAEGLPTIAFCCSHRHAKRVASSFNSQGVAAEVYLSTTSQQERRELVRMMQTGDLKILCAVDVLNEGADLPYVEALLFLRPTESKRIFYQQIGRGLRRYVGKSHCTVIDFIGNFKNAYKIPEFHGLLPFEDEAVVLGGQTGRTAKEIFNLPLGCRVCFDDRVIDVFAEQTLNPRHATRHNIGRILVLQYRRLARHVGRKPTRNDVDRNCLLDSSLYKLVFGSWKKFLEVISDDGDRTQIV